ncbi:MAG: hypothetical protein J6U54_12445 [Clostridiales bacterium]|nr:hypothetical protein [Clostridiales bacterium]
MKKIKTVAVILMTAIVMAACSTERDDIKVRSGSAGNNETEETETTVADDDDLEELQIYEEELGNAEKPETIKVELIGKSIYDIRDLVTIDDIYKVDYLTSGVVGLIGSPVEIDYTDLSDVSIRFTYDPNELRGIPEKNLIVLHENDQFYDTVEGSVLDVNEHTVTAPVEEPGIYLLVDAYQWYSCWGIDVSDYEYDIDKTQFESDWEREVDTGDIMELADKEWGRDNYPDYHVSTAEELASVVYYVNAIGGDQGGFQDVYITLEDDIDISGYVWAPLGWYGASSNSNEFRGVVDGQGHTINGLTLDRGYEDTGFLGYGSGIEVKDINFTNANVTSGGCVGIVGGELYGTSVWENVSVEGKIYADERYDHGAIIGREGGITFVNCKTEVTINDEPFQYYSYRDMKTKTTEVEETFTLTLNDDYSITRDEHDGFDNLTWHIEHNGVQVLRRGAEDELTLSTQYAWIDGSSGSHTIYLVAYKDDFYVRVSNIIEYEQ